MPSPLRLVYHILWQPHWSLMQLLDFPVHRPYNLAPVPTETTYTVFHIFLSRKTLCIG